MNAASSWSVWARTGSPAWWPIARPLAQRPLSGRAVAPPAGAEVRAGFLFDVPVRFAEDRLDISAVNFAVGEAPSIPLIELRETA